MKTSFYSIFILFTLVLMVSNPVLAQSSYDLGCREAESTSSIQKCLKNKLEEAQNRLKDAYSALDKKFDNQNKSNELKQLQTSWLKYRDDECMWEANHASTPGLKGINELSCMVRVSEDRADLLEITYIDIDPDLTRQYANTSRWKNILRNNYKETVWDFNNAITHDLQCGDTQEIIAQGHKFVQTEDNKNLFYKNKVLALVINPAIGRPEVTTFDFEISNNEEDKNNLNILCDDKIELSFSEREKNRDQKVQDANNKKSEDKTSDNKNDNKDDNTDEEKACQPVMTIEQNKCIHKNIMWNEKEFVLSNIEIEEDNEKETKIEDIKE